MKRFIEGEDRSQATLLPEYLDDYIGEDNLVRAVDAFVEELDLKALGFEGADPAVTGRPSYHPAVLLELYIYGYLNRVPSSRRLEREAQRNVELMWLTGRLAPDFKTTADFRRDNAEGIWDPSIFWSGDYFRALAIGGWFDTSVCSKSSRGGRSPSELLG